MQQWNPIQWYNPHYWSLEPWKIIVQKKDKVIEVGLNVWITKLKYIEILIYVLFRIGRWRWYWHMIFTKGKLLARLSLVLNVNELIHYC